MKGPTKANGATPARGSGGVGATRGRATPHRSQPAPRDQHESAFAAILADLVLRVPGARSAALVDRDGETVDYAGRGNPYEMRVAAAHLRIVLDETLGQPSLAAVRSLVVRAARASFAIHALPDGYALVVLLTRGAGFRGLGRAVSACTRSMADEAGWTPARSAWYAMDVVVDPRGAPDKARPVRSGAKPEPEVPVEILGRYRFAEHERAWRVRVPTGVELTLVREPGGFWYADEPVTLPPPRPLRPPRAPGKKNL
jgi:hypothetical protein